MTPDEEIGQYRDLIHTKVARVLGARYQGDWDDVVQESLLKLLKARESKRTSGEKIHSVDAYAAEIALSCCIDFFRKIRRKSFATAMEVPEAAIEETGIEQVELEDEIRAIDDLLRNTFKGIDYIVAIKLRSEDPVTEIQAATGYSRATTYRRMAMVTEKIVKLGREHDLLSKVFKK